MARILVTGGSGFIGSHICDRLTAMGHEVVCIDNLMTSKKDNISHLLNRDGFKFIEGDIRDTELMAEVLAGCTHVCHQAALGSVPRSIKTQSLLMISIYQEVLMFYHYLCKME